MRRLRFLSVTSGYGTTTDDDERARSMQLTTLHEKKQATTTSKPQPQPHTYILDQVVTHLRKEEGRCESIVSGEEKGRKHFHGEGGKVWDSASSGSQRRTNNFNNSIIRLLVERNEGHLFRTISSFATLINHRRSKFSRVEADGTKESVLLETERRGRGVKERKKVFFSYSYLLATVTTHPATFSTSSKQCSRGDRFPAPSPFLLLDNCNRGGESQWRSYLLRVSVRRVRIEGAISLLERNTGSQRILRTATVITTSDNPRSMPGGRGGEEGILENVCLATA